MENLRAHVFEEGDWIIVIDRKMRKKMFRLKKGAEFTVYGHRYPHDVFIGKEEGSCLEFSSGRVYIFRPSMRDYVLNVKRNVQPIYPKDLGFLLYYANVKSGDFVLEVGLGVGALSIAILNVIGPRGKLVTYERRKDFAVAGRRRVENFLGSCPNFEVVVEDASFGIDYKGFDAAFIDVPEPWAVITNVANALKVGAYVIAFIPTTIQIHQYWEKLKEMHLFYEIEIMELLLRNWDVSKRSLRPAHRMVAHTGFIVVARKLNCYH